MKKTDRLTAREANFLMNFGHIDYLPLARFCTGSTKSGDANSVALDNVFLKTGSETIPEINLTADTLESLESRGIISLDYDIPLANFDYALFENSDAFALLVRTVEEGRTREGYLFDRAYVEKGSIAPTKKGRKILRLIARI